MKINNKTGVLRFIVAIFIAILVFSCSRIISESSTAENDALPEEVDYNFHIRPLLSDRCYTCHGPDPGHRKSNLRLDAEEYAFVRSDLKESKGSHILKPKSLSKSEVYQRIISDDPEYMMPPPDSHLSLNDYEKNIIKKWIQQGAKYEPHWSFQKPLKSRLPKIENVAWVNNSIDHFTIKEMERRDLYPSEVADKNTLLRRIAFDLTGLPPTSEEIDEFLNDTGENVYEKAISRYMDSPHFGEKWALDWLDVARYADTHGYQDDGMRTTWPWRDWVIKSFNENKPFDDFILEQLAGDMIPEPTRDQILATCFNRNHPQSQEGGVVDEEYRVEYVADRTNTFGKAFLGLSTECARCHDHKYDPISQKDYFSLFAYFNNNNDAGIVPYVGEAAPTVMLPTEEEEEKLNKLKLEIRKLEQDLLPENYLSDLGKWMEEKPSIGDLKYGLVADFDFEKEVSIAKQSLNLNNGGSPGWANIGKKGNTIAYLNGVKNKLDAAILGDKDRRPELIEGKFGKGIKMRGDCGIRFNRDLDFDRSQPFSVSIWINLLKEGEQGPIFNNANGDFEGYRGWLCKLNEDGTLSYQLNHVWPDNCIDYKTKTKLPIAEWTHLAMTYDGGSRAAGVKLYINGEKVEAELLKDNLNKSILHGIDGKNWTNYPFMLGRVKERSIENMAMDELKIYNRQLSPLEVTMLAEKEINITADKTQSLYTYLFTGKNQHFNDKLAEITTIRAEENEVSTNVTEVMVMNERERPRETYLLERGAYDAPSEKVEARLPEVFDIDQNISDRLELAQWVVSEDNPLTSRVIVNRFWLAIFGKGIVASPDNFGSQGALPTHPELLDWLAIDFMENGWDVRKLLTQILTSATYQQSSVADAEVKTIDPGNEWYSRFPAHRLSAELIRDNALAASGLLVPKIGGPSVYPYQPKGIWKALATRNATEYKVGQGDDLYRRSMYTIWKRSSPPPSMMNFDAPERYFCVVERQTTATPLQSLVLMNDPQFVEASKAMAEKIIKSGGNSIDEQVDFLCKSLIGRSPDEKEKAILLQLYEEEKASLNKEISKVDAILSVGEYKVSADVDKVEVASRMLLASTMMNYDEFIMKR